jgi:hypothetical protein
MFISSTKNAGMRPTNTVRPNTNQKLESPEPPSQKDSFVRTHKEDLVGLAGLTGVVGGGLLAGSYLPSGMNGLTGALVGMAAGAGTGVAAGLVAGEGFLLAYPLDPANEKEKYTALTRGLAGLVGGIVGGIVGGVSGYCGTQSWLVAPASVLTGAGSAGLTNAGLNAVLGPEG